MTSHQECVYYVERLQQEHRELYQRLRQLQAELNHVDATLVDASLLAEMRARGEELRRDLARHFKEEETSGCLEDATGRVPGLAAESHDLLREHPALLRLLDELLTDLRTAVPNELTIASVKQKFETFVVQLLAHEGRENRIVERSFQMAVE